MNHELDTRISNRVVDQIPERRFQIQFVDPDIGVVITFDANVDLFGLCLRQQIFENQGKDPGNGEPGAVVFNVEVVTADSKVFDVKVDAADGKVLSSKADSADRSGRDEEDEKD